MSNHKSIDELIESLQMIQLTLCDTAEPSVRHELDEVIKQLQKLKSSNQDSSEKYTISLMLADRFLRSLPSIAKLIEILMR